MSATESTATNKSKATKGNQSSPSDGKGLPTVAPNAGGDTNPERQSVRDSSSPTLTGATERANGNAPPSASSPPSSSSTSLNGGASAPSRDNLRAFDWFGSNNSMSSFSALSSFSSLPSLPSIPALLEPNKKTGNSNEPAHRDVTVTATTPNPPAGGASDNGRLVSPTPASSLSNNPSPSPAGTQHPLPGPPQRSRPLPPLQPLPSSPQPQQPAQQQQQQSASTQPPQPAAQQQPPPQQQQSATGMNALVATQNQRRIVNPVSVPNGQNFVDITEYLNMPQSEAAKKLSIPPSTLSKRWKEAVRNRKWPWRVVCKLDKEIMTLLHNVPQGAPIPEEIEGRLGYLMRKRQEELKPVVIRL